MEEKIKILIADDEFVIRELLTDVLQDYGYEVVAVENGKKAVEKVKEKQFKIIISDVHMPVMNGFEALKAIKKISPDISIIMMDSYPDFLTTLALKVFWAIAMKPGSIIAVSMKILFMDI